MRYSSKPSLIITHLLVAVNCYRICKSVKRMGVDDFIRIGVKSSIEDWILDDLQGICSFLRLKQVPSPL